MILNLPLEKRTTIEGQKKPEKCCLQVLFGRTCREM
jgi:hypothetical protein